MVLRPCAQTNMYETEHCRLSGLPDLNHSMPYVQNTLADWVAGLVANFSADGIRIDTVPEVPPAFWRKFSNAAGVYTVGEVFNGDVKVVAPYQGPVDGVLSYPLFFTMRNVFMQGQSATQLRDSRNNYEQFSNINVLGTYVNFHHSAGGHANNEIESNVAGRG
jgi:alpha-amylase